MYRTGLVCLKREHVQDYGGLLLWSTKSQFLTKCKLLIPADVMCEVTALLSELKIPGMALLKEI